MMPALDAAEAGTRIARALDAAGIAHAIGGALALGVHGVPRGTLDVDATASCILGSIKQVLEQYLVHTAERDFDVERFAQAIVQYNLNGVLAR